MNYSIFAENRKHALNYVKSLGGLLILKGHPEMVRPGTDYEHPIFQESNFYYLTGVPDENSWLVWDVEEDVTHLFFDLPPEDAKTWMKVESFESKKRYPANFHHKVEELPNVVAQFISKGISKVHILEITSESVIRECCKLPETVSVSNKDLQYLLGEARVIKTPGEIELMRMSAKHSSEAHIQTMKHVRDDMTETDIEAIWYYYMHKLAGTDGKFHAFLPIVSFGSDAAVLHHYAEDNVKAQPDQMCLLDAGSTYKFYAADITRTFPISGKFAPKHRFIYETVLEMQLACIDMVKAGVMMIDIHEKALTILAERLMKEGIIKTSSAKEAIEKNIAALFMPHGLGHQLGIDTHDVGGYVRGGPVRDTRPSFMKLRTNRVLQPGMVITIEPGCYFNPNIIEPAVASNPEMASLIDMEKIRGTYYAVGGVRIEDDVLVTPDGHDVLTCVPKNPDDIEKLMAEGQKLPPWM